MKLKSLIVTLAPGSLRYSGLVPAFHYSEMNHSTRQIWRKKIKAIVKATLSNAVDRHGAHVDWTGSSHNNNTECYVTEAKIKAIKTRVLGKAAEETMKV